MNRGQEEYGSNVTEKNKSDSILDLFLFLRLFMLALHFCKEYCLELEIYRTAYSQGSDL